ncbi:hypothetical protein [Pseudoalteromonas luteoviolacea]|uniref:hypothetical protein n=1 Tax=Pseudoalteromonas luteoviolacea TaxID=43657 RepID=UPI0011537DEA|nr:hypothetical protein [Pseudoalteromonas luteoviolacea]TQF68052.1 hypothetical protein FLM44_23070 [Pseudoalteromonas luteoviolacea]
MCSYRSVMDIPIEEELKSICIEIVDQNYSTHQWSETESSDMFQSPSFVGGFDADELEFCFSYFDENRIEFWFQFTLEQAKSISKGESIKLSGMRPEQKHITNT